MTPGPVSADEQRFLDAIERAPSANEPRYVYADWLSERGRPLGELIWLQCELSSLSARSEFGPRTDELRAAETQWLARHGRQVFGRFVEPRIRLRFDRGFVVGFNQDGLFVSEPQHGTRRGLRFSATGRVARTTFESRAPLFAERIARWMAPGHAQTTVYAYELDGLRPRVEGWPMRLRWKRGLVYRGLWQGITLQMNWRHQARLELLSADDREPLWAPDWP